MGHSPEMEHFVNSDLWNQNPHNTANWSPNDLILAQVIKSYLEFMPIKKYFSFLAFWERYVSNYSETENFYRDNIDVK